ncbi:MAG TPA: sugar ABC transporter ATP-binding protein [Baekduia sp.]|nr:sugar ABC transporter ATP-binding protein [Baekduia sp.]
MSKRYGGVRAVRDLDLSIERGSVHAIVGENGAGKSTVGKIIGGVIPPSGGELLVDGEAVTFASPRQALGAGIAVIAQELALVPTRSVMANVFLGAESRRGALLDRRRQRARFDELIERTGFDLPADLPVGALRIADQQKVEILRATVRNAELIVMDEPTAPLTQVEAKHLYEIIRRLTAAGTTIVYVSHFLEEVLELSDTVTVMRDGQLVSSRPAAEETTASLVRSMLGRSLELNFPERRPCDPSVEPVLQVRDITGSGRFENISFDLRPGEIVGMAGLVGSGRSEVLRALSGADRIDSGEILLDGKPVRLRNPQQAISSQIVMLPESRKEQGLVMTRSVAENMVLSSLRQHSGRFLVRRDKRREHVQKVMSDLDVRAASQDAPIVSLSGGNQQKVLLGKCLMASPRVLLIDEPTQGVDVGAKRAIYDLIADLAADGMAVLVVSSELEEVLGLAHRILVMSRRRLVAELQATDADQESILAAAFGTGTTA